MKISKRISLIFICATILYIILYIVFSAFLNQNYYKSELFRARGISKSILRQFNNEITVHSKVAKNYVSGIEFLMNIHKDMSVMDIIENEVELNEFDSNDVDKEIVFGINGEGEIILPKVFDGSEEKEIINKLRDNVTKDKNFNGIIDIKSNLYFIGLEPIENIGKQNYYVLVYTKIDDNFMKSFSKTIERNIELKIMKSEVDKNNSENYVLNSDDKIKFYANLTDKDICVCISLGGVNGEDFYYLVLNEQRMVKKNNSEKIIVFTIIVAIMTLIINYVLYRLVKNIVIERIKNISDSVNQIPDNAMEEDLLEEDDFKDEITQLSKNINSMLNRIIYNNKYIENSEKRYKNILSEMTNGYINLITHDDINGKCKDIEIIEINDSAKKILKINEDVRGKSISELDIKCKYCKKDVVQNFDDIKVKGYKYYNDNFNILDDVWVTLNIYTLEDKNIYIILNDITELKRSNDNMKKLVNFDSLTMLMNRYSIRKYLKHLKNVNDDFSLFFIDLDNFKIINDTLGHEMGDKVLKVVAEELKKLNNDELEKVKAARLGGDEFIVVREGKNDIQDINVLGNKVVKSLNKTINFEKHTFEVSGSVGVTLYPEDSEDIDTLVKYGDIAMYEAKRAGGNRFKFFNESMMDQLVINSSLKNALEKNEFKVVYQPIYNVKEEKICGSEALIRWYSESGTISPLEFIPIAKQSDDIILIDNFVIKTACEFCGKIVKNKCKEFEMSINISHKSLRQANFIDMMMDTLLKNSLEPKNIKLEITEDELMDEEEVVIGIVKKIKETGIKISLDDFGVGYSSFNYIKTLPLDIVKVDRSLIMSIESDKKTIAIIETLINLCHILNLEIVCEGVEYKKQFQLLKSIECDKIQGFYFSKPLSEEDFFEFFLKFNKY